MKHRTSVIALAAAGALLFLLAVVTTVTGGKPPTAGASPKSCNVPLHWNAADPGKNSPASFGRPLDNPSELPSVDMQVIASSAEDPVVNESMRWATHAPAAPTDVDGINRHIAWSSQSDKLRCDDHQNLMAWIFDPSTKREIISEPAGTKYWTLATTLVDGRYAVYQTQVTLQKAEPFLQVTTPDGTVTIIKLSCHLQPASIEMFPGIPTQPPTHLPPVGRPPKPCCITASTPSGPQGTTPTTGGCKENCNPTTTVCGYRCNPTTTVCGPSCNPTTTAPGKHDDQSPMHNTSIPPEVTTCWENGTCDTGPPAVPISAVPTTPATTRPGSTPPSTAETQPVTVPATVVVTTPPGP